MGFRYRVRPTKQAAQTPCAAQLTTLLACFATTGDLRAGVEGTQGCAAAAKNLHLCMAQPYKKGSGATPSINYLLSKVRR
ncbi:uncharacterized protein LOC62_06G008060 [Vanrija pseudolonga]|uniref:37S ribosomal protein mrp10, mitochondrial n=1 Tax=Vanrija pseudolonga TaxID=143232 RepID=A0AAF0YGE3_9TREE|nr:hypothetical protein LOC62_06G008060 [Vanrija pseudolonga]